MAEGSVPRRRPPRAKANTPDGVHRLALLAGGDHRNRIEHLLGVHRYPLKSSASDPFTRQGGDHESAW
jgi:hypothetical protein